MSSESETRNSAEIKALRAELRQIAGTLDVEAGRRNGAEIEKAKRDILSIHSRVAAFEELIDNARAGYSELERRLTILERKP